MHAERKISRKRNREYMYLFLIVNHLQPVFLVRTVQTAPPNVTQTATAVTGLMVTVSLTVSLDGKENNAKMVQRYLTKYTQYIYSVYMCSFDLF